MEKQRSSHLTYNICKAATDRLFALTVLIISSPIWLSTSLILWLRQGQVVYRQRRAGQWGKEFTIYKFKTMNDKRDSSGVLLPDRDRITRVGMFIRTYSLDELPQLFNVLIGSMSLVGPRPLYPEYTPLYSPRQATRLQVKPGITGLAQINGRNNTTWKKRLEWDAIYVETRSISLDFWIIYKTLLAVVSGKNVHVGENLTMPRFQGNESQDTYGETDINR